MDLDPAKILLVLVVALIVLGPDKLPKAARQLGAAWGQLRQWRARLEEEVRGAVPNLPSTATITDAVRSPLSFLDRLADEHTGGAPGADPAVVPPSPAPFPAPGGPGSLLGQGNDGPVPGAALPIVPREAPAGDPSMN